MENFVNFTYAEIQRLKNLQKSDDDYMYRYYLVTANSGFHDCFKVSPMFKFRNAAEFIRNKKVYFFIELENECGIETIYELTNVVKIKGGVQCFDKATEFHNRWMDVKETRDNGTFMFEIDPKCRAIKRKRVPEPNEEKKKVLLVKEEKGKTAEDAIELEIEQLLEQEEESSVTVVPGTPEHAVDLTEDINNVDDY